MRLAIILFIVLYSTSFSSDEAASIYVIPGINEIKVNIVNDLEQDVGNLRFSLNQSTLPQGINIVSDSLVAYTAEDNIAAIFLKLEVSDSIEAGLYAVPLTLYDDNHTWDYSLDLQVDKPIPSEYDLAQNYPNPFNLSTIIKYSLPGDNGNVKIEIYDVTGAKVRTLVNKEQKAGEYSIQWDGRNDNNMVIASGVYIYRIKAGTYTNAKKMLLLK